MKNIGIVTTWLERGAAYVSKQYRDILQDDFNIFIYARGGESYAKNNTQWDDKNVTWAKKIPLPVNMAIDKKDFQRWIFDNKIDLIIFNEQQWWLPVIWAKEVNIICVSYIDYYTEETIPLFEIFDILLCNTKRHYDTFKWHSNAQYIPWGTDINLYKPKNFKIVNEKCITFFHSAGMSPDRKGTQYLLQAFNQAKGNKKLIIHTQISLFEKLPEYHNVINNLLKTGELEIINQTISAPGLYYLGDVYVYPSKLDGIGLTITEAISCGLPTIVPDNAPMNEFINEESGKKVNIDKYYARADGYYWPQCEVSVTSLKESLEYYIDKKDSIERYKKRARDYATKNLNWFTNKEELVNLILSSANNKQSLEQEKIYKKIYKYEKKRFKYNILNIVYYRFPRFFRVLGFVYNVYFK